MKDDIEATQADIEDVTQTGDKLVELCGKPDRPEVEKNINDLQSNLGTVADKFEKRSKDLEVALTKAVHFQDELMVNEIYILYIFLSRSIPFSPTSYRFSLYPMYVFMKYTQCTSWLFRYDFNIILRVKPINLTSDTIKTSVAH